MKSKLLIILLFICLIGTVGTTLSYFRNNQVINNNLKSNEYTVSYNYDYTPPTTWHPGDTIKPVIKVENKSEMPIAIRAKISEIWTTRDGNNLNTNLYNNENSVDKTYNTTWFKVGDYYYYYKLLNKNEISDSLINELIYNSNTSSNMSCTTNSNGTICGSNNDYSEALYKLNITFETIQGDSYEKNWKINLSSPKSLYNHIEQQSLYADMKSTNVDSSIEFYKESSNTNGTGIYKVLYENNPIHFYRGNIDNNNVLFANKCWQIVRTTDTKGIKLVYNGEFTNNICSGTDKNIGPTGYNTTGTMEDGKYMINNLTENSIIKTTIDNWYENNLLGHELSIEDYPYCNDTTIYHEGSEVISYRNNALFGGAKIINNELVNDYPNGQLNFKCSNINDSYTVSSNTGNKKLKYPIATIDSQEIYLAGASAYGISETVNNFYLYDETPYWAFNPAGFHKARSYQDMFVQSYGIMLASKSYRSYYVRPMITLKNPTYTSGNGKPDNPFIIYE